MSMSPARRGALTKTFRYTLLVAALVGLTACGGGGSSSSVTTPPGNSTGGGSGNPDGGTGGGSTGGTDGGSTGGTDGGSTGGTDGGSTGGTDGGSTGGTDGGSTGGTDGGSTGGTDGGSTGGTDGGSTGGTDGGSTGGGTVSTLTITWEQPMSNVDGTVLNDLAGYRIYWGSAPGVYTDVVQVNDPAAISHTITTPSPGTYYFTTTAYDQQGNEGPYSNLASILIN